MLSYGRVLQNKTNGLARYVEPKVRVLCVVKVALFLPDYISAVIHPERAQSFSLKLTGSAAYSQSPFLTRKVGF